MIEDTDRQICRQIVTEHKWEEILFRLEWESVRQISTEEVVFDYLTLVLVNKSTIPFYFSEKSNPFLTLTFSPFSSFESRSSVCDLRWINYLQLNY